MHRSGTSLLGSLLPELGVAMPGELIAADEHNPEGYHEWEAITELQEHLLMALGRWWPGPYGPEPLPAHWLEHPATQQTREQLHQLLSTQIQRQDGPWAIKDPRTSLLLPLWRELAASLQVPLQLALAIRDPAEVLISLVDRDGASTGMDGVRAQRLWWRHNRQVLIDGHGLPLLVVDYGQWFSQPEAQLLQLANFCGKNLTAATLSRVCHQIQPQHRRSLEKASGVAVHPRLRQLYRHLQHHPINPQLRALPSEPLLSRRQQWRCWLHAKTMEAIRQRAWFDPVHYREQLPTLPITADPLLHYLRYGWRQQLSPHPQLGPTHPRALVRGQPTGSPQLDQAHRLGCAALALRQGHASQATALLNHWLHKGRISHGDLLALADLPDLLLASLIRQIPKDPLASAATIRLEASNSADNNFMNWALHAWLQRCPIDPGKLQIVSGLDQSIQGSNDFPVASIALQLAPMDPAGLTLQQLERFQQLTALFDPCPKRVNLWRRLGVAAVRLPAAEGLANGWLARSGDAAAAAMRLGLPNPSALIESNKSNGIQPVICVGQSGDQGWLEAMDTQLWYLPGFDQLCLEHPDDPRLLASWLELSARAGAQLVRLNPSQQELQLEPWRALSPTGKQRAHTSFQDPISPEELLQELDWYSQGKPPPPAIQTPRAKAHIRWLGGDAGETTTRARASLCISLYNYAHTIETALESAASQTLKELELIVVNDNSNDNGAEVVEQWCSRNGHRFQRCLLLDHSHNSGLAAARNTAFQTAEADWCFVLDADNYLDPTAIEDCLALATESPDAVAVIHPLIRYQSLDRLAPSRLLDSRSWQASIFKHGNVIDAMALIRRSAWEQVGGYRHIPGGWEDFDFWCQLISAGFNGLLCPRPLATYVDHSHSMRSHSTDRRLRSLSRLLQREHPWLKMPLAQ